VVSRLFLEKLDAPNGEDAPLFVAINTLSGTIDILDDEEARILKRFIHGGSPTAARGSIPDEFLEQLKERVHLPVAVSHETLGRDSFDHNDGGRRLARRNDNGTTRHE
jgi:hypothetical protein